MADEAPTPEEMVPSFLHAFMWASAFGAVEELRSGRLWSSGGLLFAAGMFHVVGVKWPIIKPNLGPRFAAFVERIAGNRWYRRSIYAVIAIVLLVSVGLAIYRQYHRGLSNATSPPIQSPAQTSKTGPTTPSLGSQSVPVNIKSPTGTPSSKVVKPHTKPRATAVPVPAMPQPEETAPQVRQPFDSNALSEFLRSKPLLPDRVSPPTIPVRIETSDEILEEIKAVLEKDRESEEMQGCPAGTSVELRIVGNDISYYLCTRQCFAAWRKVNLKDLDFVNVKVSQPFDDHRLALVEIPCHPHTWKGPCLTEEVGTFPSKECVKKKLKTNYYKSLGMTVHADNADSLARLWKEFGARYK